MPDPGEIMFVCWGNICRSPLAEHLFRKLARERGLAPIATASLGLLAEEGGWPIEETVRAGRLRGVDVSGHRARRFAPALLGPAPLLLVMEREHRRSLIEDHGVPGERIRLLASWLPGEGEDPEIADPGGGPWPGFIACVERIEAAVAMLVAEGPPFLQKPRGEGGRSAG